MISADEFCLHRMEIIYECMMNGDLGGIHRTIYNDKRRSYPYEFGVFGMIGGWDQWCDVDPFPVILSKSASRFE